jgi:hypothetical protein
MLLRLAGLGALLAASAPAQATDWYYVDSAVGFANVTFIDRDSIAKNADGNITGSMFSVLSEVEDGALAYRFVIEVDCEGKLSRLVAGEQFDAARKSQGVAEIGGDWEPVDPNTQGQTISAFFCTRGGSRPGEPSLGPAYPFDTALERFAAHRAGKAD